ncbi:MAG: indolepyruvate ferredoxin oxidoreductase subunit alpha [Deltaproteobacteria bacterium]|nr:indolepyruvate ferredoxin oxidoreductase subunit alpha [Candidatus Anaeroferrophillus wilburensis]MBN2889123.1 indolepyruvate ferredoxin oxidoreductase subunit alpha [Deltaproteobacteria bacterium]
MAEQMIMSGNEAIARGAYEAGVRLAAAYPGTPSTEILENVAQYEEIYSEWSPNEKVALEVGVGSSMAGARTLVAMKHVGINVAADPLFTLSYTGVGGGLILISADDPAMHSSQNEQDNRNYGKFAKIPVIEPSDSQEAKDFVSLALDLSEQFDTPVLYRTTTRISHSKSIVSLGERTVSGSEPQLEKNMPKYTMLPAFARQKHPLIEERIAKLKTYAETSSLNRVEMADTRIGVITNGITYQYVKDALPQASVLKLGLTYPLPEQLIRDFAAKVDKLYVIEELDPFFEEQIRVMGIKVDHGKDLFPICGEFSTQLIREKVEGSSAELQAAAEGLPARPPAFCPGCSHRGIFTILKKLKVFVSGDIGCYTLGALPPIQALHSCVCMGASISMAHGMSHVVPASDDLTQKTVAVIGDSTFFHSGMTGLLDAVYNKGSSVIMILDNRTTGMTGGQENPGTGKTLAGEDAIAADIPAMAKAFGIKDVVLVDPYNLQEIEDTLREELAKPELSVILVKAPCVLRYRISKPPLQVDPEKCTGCKRCLQVSCNALGLVEEGEKSYVQIDQNMCIGCSVCAQVCKFDAIS